MNESQQNLRQTSSQLHDQPQNLSIATFQRYDYSNGSNSRNGGKVERGGGTAEPGVQNFHFFAKTDTMARARVTYIKTFLGGVFLVVLTIFAALPIYWGSLWRVPDRPLTGWVVDFDGGEVGEFFVESIIAKSNNAVTWSQHPESTVGSPENLQNDIKEERAWVAIAINARSSARLNDATQNPSIFYNGSFAITVYGAEARNENAYRDIISPTVTQTLDNSTRQFALQFAQNISTSTQPSTVLNILSTSPQTLVVPVSYTIQNLLPFDEPAASAATFSGMIYMLILSFFIVVIADGARNAAGLNKLLSYSGLVCLRLTSSVLAYFFISVFFSLVNVAFQIDFTHKFGHAGFVVYWMVNWAGMMAVGLALESLVTVLTTRLIPFFMIFWIICNISVCFYPIQTLPRIFRYGYAAPFYNVSRAFRTIAFNTKNQLVLNFGVLFVWIAISFITLPFFQWIVWRQNRRDQPEHRDSS